MLLWMNPSALSGSDPVMTPAAFHAARSSGVTIFQMVSIPGGAVDVAILPRDDFCESSSAAGSDEYYGERVKPSLPGGDRRVINTRWCPGPLRQG